MSGRLTVASAGGDVLNVAEGIIEGTLTFVPRGDGGFGYDPLFVPNGYDQTFAELSAEIKNRISHRALAAEQMRALMREVWHLG